MTPPTLPPEIEAAIEDYGFDCSIAYGGIHTCGDADPLRTAITSALAAAREAGRRDVLEGAAGVESSMLKLAAVAYSQGTHAVRARIGEDGADRDHLRASGDLIVAEQSHRAAIAADKARAVEAASDAAFDRGRAATIKYADGLDLRPVLSADDATKICDAYAKARDAARRAAERVIEAWGRKYDADHDPDPPKFTRHDYADDVARAEGDLAAKNAEMRAAAEVILAALTGAGGGS